MQAAVAPLTQHLRPCCVVLAGLELTELRSKSKGTDAEIPAAMQAHEANVRLRKELQLEQQRRQIAVGALVGGP